MKPMLVMLASAVLALCVSQEPSDRKVRVGPHGDPQFVEPPGAVSGAIAERLSRAREALERGGATSVMLADPSFAPLRPFTEFRELIRAHAKGSKSTLVPEGEPGTRLTVKGRVVDAEEKPVEGALVYAYQTSSKGWYAAEAPHISGNSGDTKHARLFAYVRTAADGTFELSTVRPGGYPRSDLPQHIHLAIDADRGRLDTEIVFEDDPRLVGEVLEEALRAGFVIVRPERLEDGSERCTAQFALRRR
jgi:protocatechuate 3,4-dioxygenase beta subunit